jgi:formylglycine-generating enzyme required for sulfatase activity
MRRISWLTPVFILCVCLVGCEDHPGIVELPGGASMEFVWIEPGTFTMGTSAVQEQALRDEGLWQQRDGDEKPAHQVTLSQGFWLGKCEITQGQWKSVMGNTPWAGQAFVRSGDDNPAVWISWNDVQRMVQLLNESASGSSYRLPTEAEWEYACRAGSLTRWSFGDDASLLEEYAWYSDNVWNVGRHSAHRVGTRRPNPWGLQDRHGNVWEWCQDRLGDYASGAQIDPEGTGTGPDRVLRGGYFCGAARSARSGLRYYCPPDEAGYGVGARLVRTD